jgi:hypothetical protein
VAVPMMIEDTYRKVKSLTRQLGIRDGLYLVWAYSQYLQVNDFELPRDIEAAPWCVPKTLFELMP